MATSGTTSTTVFRTNKVIDQAYRRAGVVPQKITAELIESAKNSLFTYLSGLANLGIPLWSIESILVPMYAGKQTVPMPVGVADVLNANLRMVQRLSGTASASTGTAENAFDSDLATACTQSAPDGYIQLQLASATRASVFGLMTNASGTWNYTLQGSDDGVTWTTFYTAVNEVEVDGVWLWWDVEGLIEYAYYRIQASGGTTLDVTELVFANTPQEVPVALINRDDYYNLPDKTFLGRPTQYWLDKQRVQQNMILWPAPAEEFTFSQLRVQVQNYLQDIGGISQELDIPQRWYEHIIWKLSSIVVYETPDADISRAPALERNAADTHRTAWGGESDNAPSKLVPRIRPYTR